MVTVEDVRAIAGPLPRSAAGMVRDRLKYRVGKIVYLALSRDETTLGFGFPKEERDALVASAPDKFFLPTGGDLRYHWCCAWLAALERDELEELILDAWRMVAPKTVVAAYLAARPPRP
jgi:hypothetical protein